MFNNELEQAFKNSQRSGEPLALLFIDLDKFKEINDTLGHIEGDFLLKQVAERINQSIRGADTASRIGGDEFTVILNNIEDAQQAQIVAKKLLVALRKPFQLNQEVASITASVGIALYPENSLMPEDLLKKADQAMYVSKKAGRDCYHFWSEGS